MEIEEIFVSENNGVIIKTLSEREINIIIDECKLKNAKCYLLNKQNNVYDKKALFDNIFGNCEFPGYFGFNWDALRDCLRDYSFAPAKGYIFIIMNLDNVKRNLHQDYGTLLEIFTDACMSWKDDSIPFKLILS